MKTENHNFSNYRHNPELRQRNKFITLFSKKIEMSIITSSVVFVAVTTTTTTTTAAATTTNA
jgi:hypothetical protein